MNNIPIISSIHHPSEQTVLSTLLIGAMLMIGQPAASANPISTMAYAADPSAHVFGDRLYVYPSHDRTDAKEFDMTDYHVYSTDDLKNWTDHGSVLDVKDVPWGKSHMWAPDAAFRDGTYYLCFCPRPSETSTDGKKIPRPIGMATSKSPTGPFVSAPKPIADVGGIDPSIFIDDDGQAYISWAGTGKGPQIAKLKSDLMELDGEPRQITGLERFFEGPWIFKRQGFYYLTYPAVMEGGSGRGGNGQWWDYATAKSPMGPYTYRGNFSRTEPGDGNIHGSQVEWNGKWYHIYHDFSQSVGREKHGFKRTIHIDEMTFGPDGSIESLKKTKDGPVKLKNIDPFAVIQAETTSATDLPEGPHAVKTRRTKDGEVVVADIQNGDWLKVSNADFGADAKMFSASVAVPKAGSQIVLHLDKLDGPVIGRCAVPPTGSLDTWINVSCPVTGAKGLHDIFLEFIGPDDADLLNIDFYQFQP